MASTHTTANTRGLDGEAGKRSSVSAPLSPPSSPSSSTVHSTDEDEDEDQMNKVMQQIEEILKKTQQSKREDKIALKKMRELLFEEETEHKQTRNRLETTQAQLAEITTELQQVNNDHETGTQQLDQAVAKNAVLETKLVENRNSAKAIITELNRLGRERGEQLERLSGLFLTPKVTDMDALKRRLNGTLTSLLKIVGPFAGELGAPVFKGPCWGDFQRRVHSAPSSFVAEAGSNMEAGTEPLSLPLPLQPQNTRAARLMRTAAIVHRIAQAAAEQLFQPIYGVQKSQALCQWLGREDGSGSGSGSGQDQALPLRMMLLRAQTAPYKETMVSERVATVKGRVARLVDGLLPEDRQGQFLLAFGQWCETVAKMWLDDVQPLAYRVQCRGSVGDQPYAALSLQLSHTSSPLPGHRVRDAVAKAEVSPSSTLKVDQSVDVAVGDHVFVVWPFFVAIPDGTLPGTSPGTSSDSPAASLLVETLLTRGIALTAADVAEARKEHTAAAASKKTVSWGRGF